ncbi:MAG: hypothetical protein AB7Q17_01500 [Phycisphaerae bacterium]
MRPDGKLGVPCGGTRVSNTATAAGVAVAAVLLGCASPTAPVTNEEMPPVTAGTTVTGPVSFAEHIAPIFQTHCVVCHAEGRTADRLGISMRLKRDEAYDSIVNQPSSQSASFVRVMPGSPEQSLLYLKISLDQPPIGNRMPLACDKLPDSEIELVRRWIAEGALNN